MTLRFALLTGAAFLATDVTMGAARAQPAPPQTPQAVGPLDPVGVRVGTFLVQPSLGAAATYNDNVFATEAVQEEDMLYVLTPRVTARSNWNRHRLDLNAAAELARYDSQSRENWDDLTLRADGRLDVRARTLVPFGASYDRAHEERGSPNDARGLEPTEYDLWRLTTGIDHGVSRFGVRLLGTYAGFDYDDVPALGGIVIDQDGRDRSVWTTSLRLRWFPSPNLAAFVEGDYNWRRYDESSFRDSEGYAAVGGIELRLTGLTTGEIYAGYRAQDFANPAFSTVDGITYGAALTWQPTGLTTVRITVDNTVDETIEQDASAIERQSYRVQLDHELVRTVRLGFHAGVRQDDFQLIRREDETTEWGATATYLLNRNLKISGEYARTSRSTDDARGRDLDFERNRLSFRLIGSL